jgi:hypothetical protein
MKVNFSRSRDPLESSANANRAAESAGPVTPVGVMQADSGPSYEARARREGYGFAAVLDHERRGRLRAAPRVESFTARRDVR